MQALQMLTQKFKIYFKSSVDSIDRLLLTSYPEKLQNVGVVSVFTGGEGQNTGESVPRGKQICHIHHQIQEQMKPQLFSKLQCSSYPTPATGEIADCFYVTRNNTENKDQCVECNPGYYLAIDGTCRKNKLKGNDK